MNKLTKGLLVNVLVLMMVLPSEDRAWVEVKFEDDVIENSLVCG